MGSADKCRECGTAIPADSPGGFCAQCLLGLGLAEVRSAEVEVQKEKEEGRSADKSDPSAPAAESNSGVASAPVMEKPGDRIGRYRLIEEIGYGGCGVVYMAQQEEPVRRRVALKVIKLGMDTKQVVARFEAERQALALMDHPNIARVLDAGATKTGRPYFVMELVGGIRITDYCDQNDLTTRQRLDLFIQVCRAVQHAHQKGIIHRDIKPSNVLVTVHDGQPLPKVIDFGIAKATQGRLTDQTLFTAFEQFIGTPAYMSPEQTQLGGLDVDTRSDIYSLGVLLYELLTGKTPFDTKELLARGLEAMRRTIQEKEPCTPSTRLKQELTTQQGDGSNKSKTANRKSQIANDLDWIVMKCLEKDRARRYETANGLARDIERHMNNEPVLARPPGRVYTLQKLYRRNRLMLTASGLILLAMMLGGGGVFWQWRRAKQHAESERDARQRAEQATQRALATLSQMEAIEVRRAEEYYESGDRGNMLPYLALVLRQNPSNHVAAERLFSTLSHRHWARLACPPLMHSNRVTSAMFSRDGRWVVSSAADGTAWVWDATTGRPISGPLAHQAEINTAEFSPDGLLVVTASQDHTARVWDARSGRPITDPIPHPRAVELARFSPDGRSFVTLCEDQTARLWSVPGGQSLLKPLRHGDQPLEWKFLDEVDFSPDGSLLVAAAEEAGIVRVWNCRTGESAYQLEWAGPGTTCVRFSPDGRLLAAATRTNAALIWNLATNPPQVVQLPLKGFGLSIEFSPDGQRVVTASSDGTAQVWDAESGKPIGPALRHGARVGCAMFSPEGLRVVTASRDQTVRVWDAETGEPLVEPMVAEHGAYYAQFHPDGQRVLSVSNGKAVLIWWVTGDVSRAVHTPFKASCAEFSTDGAKVLVGEAQGGAEIWQPLTGLWPTVLSGHNDYVGAAAFSADRKYVATCSSRGTARIWNVLTGEPGSRPFSIGAPGMPVMQFSPDSRLLLAFSLRGVARLWDAASGGPASPSMGEGDGVWAAQLSPNGKWVATGGTNGTARIWDAVTGQPVSAIMRHQGKELVVCFSPDGRQLLTGSATSARLWAVPSGEPVIDPIQHPLRVHFARFSPGGKYFLTAVADKPSVRVWDSSSAKLLSAFGSDVSVAEFSPDGGRVVTMSRLGRVQLWDAQTGERLTEPVPQHGSIEYTRLSSDGKLLAGVCRDGAVRFWEMPPPPLPVPKWLSELAEALAGQRFNQQGLLEPVQPVQLWAAQQEIAAWARSRRSDQELSSRSERSPEASERSRDTGAQAALQRSESTWVHWAEWFCSPPLTRTVLPSSPLTLAQYAQSLAEHRVTAAAAREALLLQPTNLNAMEAVALTSTNALLADWLSRRAIKQDSRRIWAREAVLCRIGRLDEALALLELDPSGWADNPWIWADKAGMCEKLGRLDEALAAYTRSLSLARAREPSLELEWHAVERDLLDNLVHRDLLNRWRVLKRLHRPAEAQADFITAEHISSPAPRVATARFVPVDLRHYLNQPLLSFGLCATFGATNSVAPLLSLGGVDFEVCGYVRLVASDADPDFPSREVIQIGRPCRALHFLQSCSVPTGCPDRARIGSYVVHYATGSHEEIPLIYGQNARTWSDNRSLAPAGQASEAWSGTNDRGDFLRLIKLSWENPQPGIAVQTIDFVAERADSQPLLFALTVQQ